jgi:DNA-binding Lrp family transcriptional regulator
MLLRGIRLSENSVKAYFLAIVKRGTEHVVAEKILKLEDVTDVLVTYGIWDIVARIETESLGKLDKIITEMRQFPEIEQTNTLVGGRQ